MSGAAGPQAQRPPPVLRSLSEHAVAPPLVHSDYHKIGEYILGETIGTGSFGKVKMATHAETRRQVAIKVLNRSALRNAQLSKHTKREIHHLNLLDHPHIVKLECVMSTPTDIHIVMEYCPGGELLSYVVNRGKLSVSEGRRIFQQIASAIAHCHRHGIVHRDLKLENILIDEHGNIKIGDFGFSCLMRDGDFLSTNCGSPNYASPEVFGHKKYGGPEADVWSAGVILYAILVGTMPFEHAKQHMLMKLIQKGDFKINSVPDADARKLVQGMLTVDPHQRFTMEEVLAHPFVRHEAKGYILIDPDETSDVVIYLDAVRAAAAHYKSDVATVLYSLSKELDNDLTRAYKLLADSIRLNAHREREGAKEKGCSSSSSASTSPSSQCVTMGKTPTGEKSMQLGVNSERSAPSLIMNTIFNRCKRLDWEWKIITKWCIHVRQQVDEENTDPLVMQLQLYSKSTTPGVHSYVVDFSVVPTRTVTMAEVTTVTPRPLPVRSAARPRPLRRRAISEMVRPTDAKQWTYTPLGDSPNEDSGYEMSMLTNDTVIEDNEEEEELKPQTPQTPLSSGPRRRRTFSLSGKISSPPPSAPLLPVNIEKASQKSAFAFLTMCHELIVALQK